MADLKVDDKFRDYRNSAIALSLTVTSLSSALILWVKDLLKVQGTQYPPCVKSLSMCILVVASITILSCICLQFFNYQGYKCEARALFGQSTNEKANFWFGIEDGVVCVAMLFFLLTVFLSAILFCLTV